jgi:hypothetical protein
MSAAEEAESSRISQNNGPVRASGTAVLSSQLQYSAENSMKERQDALISKVQNGLRAGMERAVQRELAKLMGLIPQLHGNDRAILLDLADIAASALLLDQPDLDLAGGIRRKIETQVRRAQNPLWTIIRGGSPPSTVILGLGCLLYFAIPISVDWMPKFLSYEKVLGIETAVLLMVALAGALGSIVSIMVRIQDFSDLRDANSLILFFTGFFKPVIGASFAMFVFSVLHAGLIPITIQENTASYFFIALSFVSGFSERFARDIATTAERQIGGVGDNLQHAAALGPGV